MPWFLQQRANSSTLYALHKCMDEGDACWKLQMQFENVTARCNHGYLMRNGNI